MHNFDHFKTFYKVVEVTHCWAALLTRATLTYFHENKGIHKCFLLNLQLITVLLSTIDDGRTQQPLSPTSQLQQDNAELKAELIWMRTENSQQKGALQQ